MTNPCQIGLRCPYLAYTEDAELICTYPKLAKEIDEDEVFGFVDEMECEILEYPSLLSDFIILKECIERGNSPTEERIASEKEIKEWQEHCEEGHKIVNKKTEVVLYRRNITEDVCQNCGITEGEAEYVLDYLRGEAAKVKLGGNDE